MARIDMPTNHPQYCGTLPSHAAGIRAALADHDVVLLVGCHAFMAHHYTPGPFIPEGIDVVQIDADPAEIGRNSRPRSVSSAASGRRTHAEREKVDREVADATAPLHPLSAVHAIACALPDDAVVADEAITAGLDLRRVLRQQRPGSYMHTVGGALGWGVGAAVDARMGDPSRPVVAVLGDGSTAFGLQSLWSAARYGVPVIFAVMNNAEHGR